MAILVDWKIKSRSGVCHHTEKAFEDEEPFYTCIFNDPESAGFIRRDFSVDAWEEVSEQLEPKPFSFWKSVYKPPETGKKDEPIKQNSIEAMLHRMIEEGRSETENTRYILALMLERKKILIPTEVKETENNSLLFYEHKDTGAVYIVADPQLHLEEVGEVQEEVAKLLENEERRARGEEVETEESADEPTDAEGTEETGTETDAEPEESPDASHSADEVSEGDSPDAEAGSEESADSEE